MTIYGAYVMQPKSNSRGSDYYREYKKFFQTELDCARYCVKHNMKYDSIFIEPDSKELMKDHYDWKTQQLAAMGH